MILPLVALLLQTDAVERIPAIYRCPAMEGESDRLGRVIEEDSFDSLCIDPKPGPKAIKRVAGKLKFVSPKLIDTTPNRKWRDATIAFVMGKIAPADWVVRTSKLKETVHFVS